MNLGSILGDLEAISIAIQDDKVTIRKKASDKLCDLLQNPNVVALLSNQTILSENSNKNSSGNSKNIFTWNNLYRATFRYMLKEAEKLQKDTIRNARESPLMSQSSMSSKVSKESNQKFLAVGLLNNVIKKANQGRTPMIRCELLLEDMISILKLDSSNPFLRKKFGAFAVQIIINRFLTVPYYFPFVPVGDTSDKQVSRPGNMWKLLLKLSIQLFEIIPDNLDFNSCCTLLHGILSNGLQYTNLLPFLKKQFRFFESVIQSSRLQQCSLETKKIFIDAMNMFLMTVSSDCRQQTCIFGESVVKKIIPMYDEKNTSTEVIKFLRIQMILHHPKGASSIKSGSYSGDSDEWKRIVISIYTNLIDTTIHNQTRQNRNRAYSVREYFLKPELVELASDVCCQLFLNSEHSEHTLDEHMGIEVTQIVPLDVTQNEQDERNTKRRKITLSFKSSLLDPLKSEYTSRKCNEKFSDEKIIPYLQIIDRLISKYPLNFERSMLDGLSSMILDLIQDCRNITVKAVLLQASENLLKLLSLHKKELPAVDLLRLWEASVNTVSLNQCMKEGNSIIRMMMERVAILQPDLLRKLYSRYFNKVIKCNQHSTKTLIFLLAYCPTLPEYSLRKLDIISYQSQDPRSSNSNDSKFASKLMLLNWLMPELEDQKDDEITNHNQIDSLFLNIGHNPRLISTILFSLTIETNEEQQKWLIGCTSSRKSHTVLAETDRNSFTHFIEDLERLTQETNLMLSVKDTLPSNVQKVKENVVEVKNIDDMCSKVHNVVFIEPSDKLLENIHRNDSSNHEINSADETGSCFETGFRKINTAFSQMKILLHFLDIEISLKTTNQSKVNVSINRLSTTFHNLLMSTVSLSTSLMENLFGNVVSFNIKSAESASEVLRGWRNLLEECIKCSLDTLMHFSFLSSLFDGVFQMAYKSLMQVFSQHISQKKTQRNQKKTAEKQSQKQLDDFDDFDDDGGFIDDSNSRNVDNKSVESQLLNYVQDNDYEEYDTSEKLFSCIKDGFLLISRISYILRLTQAKEVQNLGNDKCMNLLDKNLENECKTIEALQKMLFTFSEDTKIKPAVDIVFETIESFCCNESFGGVKPKMSFEAIHNIISLLQEVGKRTISPKKFDFNAMANLIRSLKSITPHLDQPHLGDNSSEKKNFLTFIKRIIMMQKNSDYHRYSLNIQCHMVDLLKSIAEEDPLQKWSIWTGKYYNMCSQDDRECTIDPEEDIGVSNSLLRFISNSSHKIRLKAANAAIVMFNVKQDSINQHILLKKRREFAALHSILMHLVQIEFKEGCSTAFAKDETTNRIGTVMSSLAPIALFCPYLERETIFGLILLHKSAHVHIQSLLRTLMQLASYHVHSKEDSVPNISALKMYLEPNLGFILKEYFDQGYSLKEFPYQLLGSLSLQDFVREYEKVVVITLLWCCDKGQETKSLDEVLKLMNHRKTIEEILYHNFAAVHSLYVPVIATRAIQSTSANFEDVNEQDIAKTECLDKLLTVQLTDNKFQERLSETLPEVLACVLKQVYDPLKLSNDESRAGSLLLKPNPPLATEKLIMNVFDYYSAILDKVPVFTFLTSENFLPDSLERILTELCKPLIRLSASKEHLSSIQAFHGVRLFIRRLTNEVVETQSGKSLEKQLPFLFWFIISTHINWIKELWMNQTNIFNKDTYLMLNLATENIYIVFQYILTMKNQQLSYEILEKVIQPISSNLINFITNHQKDSFVTPGDNNYTNLRKKWLQIMSIIVTDCKQKFTKATSLLVHLYPLPETNDQIFDDIKENVAIVVHEMEEQNEPHGTLQRFLTRFLANDYASTRSEVMKKLSYMLRCHRSEVYNMIVGLEKGRGFSEDASTSTLHKLVTRLLRLSFSKDHDVSEEANNCLGELGPINLSTLVLTPSIALSQTRRANGTGDNSCKNWEVVKNLLDYMVCKNNNTVLAASQALKYVLSTDEGKTVIEKLSNQKNKLSLFLNPFINALNSKTIDKNVVSKSAHDIRDDPHINAEWFNTLIGKQNLWCQFSQALIQYDEFDDKLQYESWVTHITVALLECMTKKRLSQFEKSPLYGRHLILICKEEPTFCELIFPDLILDILRRHFYENEINVRSVISQNVCHFFQKHYDYFYNKSNYSENQYEVPYNSTKCLQLMLNMVENFRLHQVPQRNNDLQGKRNITAPAVDTTEWEKNFWIVGINYLHVARAAIDCNSYFAACLYCDIWCQQIKDRYPQLKEEFATKSFSFSLLDILHENFDGNIDMQSDVERCQAILSDAYTKLGDRDAIYGCGSNRLYDKRSRIQNVLAEHKNLEAFSMYDKLVQSERKGKAELMECLLNSGCYHTLSNYAQGLSLNRNYNNPEMAKFQYECAWRLSEWSDIEDLSNNHSFSKYRHRAFQELFLNNDINSFKNNFKIARNCVSTSLSSKIEDKCQTIKVETSPVSILKGLSNLRCHSEAFLLVDSVKKSNVENLRKVFMNFEKVDNDLNLSDITYTEPIWMQRQVVLKNFLEQRSQVTKLYKDCNFALKLDKDAQNILFKEFLNHSFRLTNVSIKNRRFHVADIALTHVKNILSKENGDTDVIAQAEDEVQYHEALLAWASKDNEVAKFLMKSLNRRLESDKENSYRMTLLPEVLRTIGNWMFELKSESSSIILNDYLKKATELYEEYFSQLNDRSNQNSVQEQGLINESRITEAYASLASFCDDQYRNIMKYMESKDFEDKSILMNKIKVEGQNIKKAGANEDVRKAATILERHSNLDLDEMRTMEDDRLLYLSIAVENYSKCLAKNHYTRKIEKDTSKSMYHDLRIFRLISLWFSNAKHANINNSFKQYMEKIPSYKFTGLLYQLCARMVLKAVDGVHAKEFPLLLVKLIKRCAVDHPHHTLPIVFALANSNADEKEINGTKSKKSATKSEERSEAAQRLLNVLKDKPHLSQLIDRMEKVAQGYIKLAYLPMSSKDKERIERAGAGNYKIEIDKNQIIRSIKDFEDVPLTTLDLPVNRDAEYPPTSICGISAFSAEYSNVGGITAPKKISCLGTDGKWRPQLVKGKDDLRQDAVMQQVFGLLNTLLRKDENSQRKRLHIRTYKVVAMSQRSGVLEWCQNTTPIREFLVGSDQKSGAHARYYPSDLKAVQCRRLLMDGQKRKTSLKTFQDICKQFNPVMRHFFYENFSSPGTHMERRLAYTRSTATSSMIGYILGLGDRHVQNILLDLSTAELIHIDLGVAFEQGKILPTPETIPFRLSRDIIDGFGPSGVEGTFRRSCETTLNTLRANKEGIMTILEVLIYDPLYNWSLSPAKAYRLQHGKEADATVRSRWENDSEIQQASNQTNNNKMAERVLLRVIQKLNGMEEGYHLSVEGQVNLLIQQATDPSRLCALFPGWQPYI